MYPGEFCLGDEYKNACLSRVEQSREIMDKFFSWTKDPKHIFYFCGNVGTGKTYLAAAWYWSLREKRKHIRIFTESSLFSHLLHVQNELGWEPLKELERLCDVDYFILDDMGSAKPSEWKAEMLLGLVNYRYQSNKPTLITSNLTSDQIKENYHERFFSRLYSNKNLIIELNGEDRRQGKFE